MVLVPFFVSAAMLLAVPTGAATATPSTEARVASFVEASEAAEERGDESSAAANLWRAAEAADRGLRDYARARELYQRLLDRFPSARLSRSAASRLEYVTRGTASGDEPFRRFEVVRAEFAKMDPDTARDEVRAILEEHPEFPLADELLLWIGDRAAADGRLDEARDTYRRLAAEHPGSILKGHALAGAARMSFEMKDYEEAEKAYLAVAETSVVGAAFISEMELERVQAHVRREKQMRVVLVLMALLGLGAAATVDPARISRAARGALGREMLYTGPILGTLVLIAPADARVPLASIGLAGLGYLWSVLFWVGAARPLFANPVARIGSVAAATLGGAGVLFTLLYAFDLLVAVERLTGG